MEPKRQPSFGKLNASFCTAYLTVQFTVFDEKITVMLEHIYLVFIKKKNGLQIYILTRNMKTNSNLIWFSDMLKLASLLPGNVVVSFFLGFKYLTSVSYLGIIIDVRLDIPRLETHAISTSNIEAE